jgi:hypothetical protein
MSSPFLNLPGELRTEIYSLVLLHPDPIGPWSFSYDSLNPSLFRVNKTIHYETIPLFYSQNRFSFTYGYSEEIATFLLKIGPNNANSIRHICIAFPQFISQKSGIVTLQDDRIAILDNIQSSCNNLSMITMSPQSIYIHDLTPDRLNTLDKYNVKVISEALKLVTTRFRAIPSLQKIFVEVLDGDDGRNDVIRREMASQGWMIKPAEFVEEEEVKHLSEDEWSDFVF